MPADPLREAYCAGFQQALAIAAIACSAVAFISMLGIEKAILAGVLAGLALRGPARSRAQRRWARAAIAIAVVYGVTWVVVLVRFHAQLAQLLHLLQQLG